MANNEHTLLPLTCSQFLDSHINYWLSIGFQGIRWMQANGTFWLALTFLGHTIKWLLYMHPKTIDFWLGFVQFFPLSQHSNTLSKMEKSFTTVRSFAQWHSKRFVFEHNRAVGQRVSHNMKLKLSFKLNSTLIYTFFLRPINGKFSLCFFNTVFTRV